MRILVTGSLGTLGRPLVRELRERDHEVYGVDLRHDGDPYHWRADVAEYQQLWEAFARVAPDVVYHLAAEFGRLNGEKYTPQLWRTAMVGTRNVLDLCRDHEAQLLFASSSEVYGDLDKDWLRESDTHHHPILHPNEYALSKWANERQIMAYQQRHGTDAIRLRFFNAYGPGEEYHAYRSVVALFCHRALVGDTLPVFKGYRRTFMHVDDFIPTLANVCTATLSHDCYNIGGLDFRSVEELATIVGDHVDGVEVELIPEDAHNVRSKRPDISRAIVDLKHSPRVPLEEGVPHTLDWMREALAARV